MVRSRSRKGILEHMTEQLRSLSDFLAKAVAHRLAAIVPDPVSIQADGGNVAVALNNKTWEYISMSSVIEQGGDVRQNIENAAYSVLNSVQDFVIEFVRHGGWPSSPQYPAEGGKMLPLPSVRIMHNELRLGYGNEGDLCLELEPISLPDLGAVY